MIKGKKLTGGYLVSEEFNYDGFYSTIFEPYITDVKKLVHASENRKNVDANKVKLVNERNTFIDIFNKIINSMPQSFNVRKKEKQKRIINDSLIIEYYLVTLVENIDKTINNETLNLFLKLLISQLVISSYSESNQADIEFYLKTALKTIEFFDTSPDGIPGDVLRNVNHVRRNYVIALHHTRFVPRAIFYRQCKDYCTKEIDYFAPISSEEHVISLTNLLTMSYDHLFLNMNINDKYIQLKDVSDDQAKLKELLTKYLGEQKHAGHVIYHAYTTFFRNNLYKLSLKLKEKKEVSQEEKAMLLRQCNNLIKIFYGQLTDQKTILFSLDESTKFIYNDELSLFSRQLFVLLNEKEKNVSEPLYLVFKFLSNFKEYLKLNLNIYKKIAAITKIFYDRKIYLLSSTIYLKSINNLKVLMTEMIKIKNSIEANPIISLISLYNYEIDTLYELDIAQRNQYKIDPYIMDIMDKVTELKSIIVEKLEEFKFQNNIEDMPREKVKDLEYYERDFYNALVFASDPNLLRNFNHFYIFYLESFIKKINMEHREDLNSKLISIKASMLDINPLNVAIALIYTKLLFIFQVMFEDKHNVGRIIKNLMTGYETINEEFGLKKLEGINWSSIISIILNNQGTGVIGNVYNFLTAANILRVLLAILERLNADTPAGESFFEGIYKKSFIAARREWGMDPLVIHYLNTYLSRKGKFVFRDCDDNAELHISFKVSTDDNRQKKVNQFFDDLLKGSGKINYNYLAQLEEMSDANDNKESLLSEDHKKSHITLQKVEYYITNNKTIFFEDYHFKAEDSIFISNIIKNYLTYLGKSNINSAINYIVKEMIANANNANLKRVHFHFKGQDINKRYKFGMGDFLDELANEEKNKEYIDKIKDMELKVGIEFYVFDKNLIISVKNNYKISEDEVRIIDERFSMAKNFKDLKEIYNTRLNTKEGKGLGIIMIILLLRKIGLKEENLKFNVTNDATIVKLIIPAYVINTDKGNLITEELIKAVDYVPMIPNTIIELKKAINNPESTIEQIEKHILHDAGLSANILKRANSAFYARTTKIESIKEAIKLIGLKALSNIVTIYSSYNLLKSNVADKKIQEIIDHSERTAFLAREIIKFKKLKINFDDIYLAALLHDVGRILVETSYPDTYEKIKDIIQDRSISVDVIEDLLGGLYHSVTGALLAEKWKFPRFVFEAIKYHHTPRNAEEYFEETFLIYLANTMTYYIDKQTLYENFEQNVLEFFELETIEKFNELAETLKTKETLQKKEQ